MNREIPINLAVEDDLSEAVLRRVLAATNRRFATGTCYGRSGFGYLKKKIQGFNNAAKGTPFLVLTDLDQAACPSALIARWLTVRKHPNLLFRVAVRQVEAWVLADRGAFAEFAGVRQDLIPTNPDSILDAKHCLIDIVSKSPLRELRRDIVPSQDSTARQGPDYNGRLTAFVSTAWRVVQARKTSASLQRTWDRLRNFKPA